MKALLTVPVVAAALILTGCAPERVEPSEAVKEVAMENLRDWPPFASIDEAYIVDAALEVCGNLDDGRSVENVLLTAQAVGLGVEDAVVLITYSLVAHCPWNTPE